MTSYRGNPDLLAALLSSVVTRERTLYVVARAGDGALANAIGRDLPPLAGPVSTLSPREREVYELLCEGLSNAEIAKAACSLPRRQSKCTFITSSTSSASAREPRLQ